MPRKWKRRKSSKNELENKVLGTKTHKSRGLYILFVPRDCQLSIFKLCRNFFFFVTLKLKSAEHSFNLWLYVKWSGEFFKIKWDRNKKTT